MTKGIRNMDIGWGGVVSYHATRCLEGGIDPDVDELERYNQAAKEANCSHDRRARVVDEYHDYWYCLVCTSRKISTPTGKDDGAFDLGGFIWRRTRTENG